MLPEIFEVQNKDRHPGEGDHKGGQDEPNHPHKVHISEP